MKFWLLLKTLGLR